MKRDARGRFVQGTSAGPGRPAGVTETKPRNRSQVVRIVTAEHLKPMTMERLDKRSRLSSDYWNRIHRLRPLLGHVPEAYRDQLCHQISYLELRLSLMQAQELLTGAPEVGALLSVSRELRALYSFIQRHPGGEKYRDYWKILELSMRRRQQEASEGRE